MVHINPTQTVLVATGLFSWENTLLNETQCKGE